MRTKQLIVFGFSGLLAISCTNTESSKTTENVEEVTEVLTETAVLDYPEEISIGSLKIYPATESASFPEASLKLNEVSTESLSVNFDFMVQNYELGAQTPDVEEKGLANSGKGQHIHLIVNNGPYSAHYENSFSKEFEAGSYYALAFLSRSYHESVKNGKAFQIFSFNVGEETAAKEYDFEQALLFYSRPKGTYKGEVTSKILLDFFVANTSLGENGHLISVQINDEESFILDTWQAYYIEGLPMGENKIIMSLLNSDLEEVNPEMNKIERTFILEG